MAEGDQGQDHKPQLVSIPHPIMEAMIDFPKQLQALHTSVSDARTDIRLLGDKFSTFIGLVEKMEFGVKDDLKDHEGRIRELEKRSQAGGERTRLTDGVARFLGAPLIVAGLLALIGAYILTIRQPAPAASQLIIASPEVLQQLQHPATSASKK